MNKSSSKFKIEDFLKDRIGRMEDIERHHGMTGFGFICPRCNCSRFKTHKTDPSLDEDKRKCKNCLFVWKPEVEKYRSDNDWKYEIIQFGPLAGYWKYNVRPSMNVDETGKINTNINYDNHL